jgi:DNA processing protein
VSHDQQDRAALTYLAEPADPALGALLTVCEPAEVMAAIKADSLPQAWLQSDDSPARRRALEAALGRWRLRLSWLPDDAGLANAHRDGIRLVCPADPEWPAGLDELGAARPYALWLRGQANLRETCGRSVSIVGSRAATGYGAHVAGEIAADLAERGWAVISGGAYGIDAAAHRGALATAGLTTAGSAHAGATIAVLACGVDYSYPAGHVSLFADIADQGLIISEWPPGRRPARLRFLVRNRTIAALSGGTVIVEASERSGALNTARHAAQLGRPLMAVPGPVTSAQSAGCHRIIREWGATCVTRADDIIEMLSPLGTADPPAPAGSAQTGRPAQTPSRDGLDLDSARVLDALPARGAAGTSTIAAEAGVDLDTVLRCLGLLAGSGFIERCATGWRLRRPLPGRDYPLLVLLILEVELEFSGAVPGDLLQSVALDVLGVGHTDRALPLGGEPLVDLVQVLADQLLLGVGDLALVRLARVLQRGVVQPVPPRAAAHRGSRAAPHRPRGDEQLLHRVVGGQLVEGAGLQDDAARFQVVGQVQVDDRDPQCGLLDGLGLVGQGLDLDRPVDQLGMFMDHDACQCVVIRDELAA